MSTNFSAKQFVRRDVDGDGVECLGERDRAVGIAVEAHRDAGARELRPAVGGVAFVGDESRVPAVEGARAALAREHARRIEPRC